MLATNRMKNIKYTIKWTFPIMPYAIGLIWLYVRGYHLDLYVSLALIPFILICWGINNLISEHDLRDIHRNLTPSEKTELTRQERSHGYKIGLFLIAPFSILFGCLYAFGLRSSWLYLAFSGLFVIIFIALTTKQNEKKRVFMYSTDYGAKLASQRLHSIAGSARSD